MELSEELLVELRPITIRLFYRLFHDEFPRIWSGDLTLNQIRVNNSIFSRGMLKGRPSSIIDIVEDLKMPRTTVTRALTALSHHYSPAFPDQDCPYVEERVDPDDERSHLYGFTEAAKGRAHESIDNMTQIILDAVSEMMPVLRKHGVMSSDAELMAFIKDQIPRLVSEYLDTNKPG